MALANQMGRTIVNMIFLCREFYVNVQDKKREDVIALQTIAPCCCNASKKDNTQYESRKKTTPLARITFIIKTHSRFNE